MTNDSVILMLLGLVVTLIGVLTPIIKLISAITELTATLKNFREFTEDALQRLEIRVGKHGEELDQVTEISKLNQKDIATLKSEVERLRNKEE